MKLRTVLLSTLALAVSNASAQVTLFSQSRSVSASSNYFDPMGGGCHLNDSRTAPDFGPFDQNLTVQCPGADGANAVQHSTLTPDRFDVQMVVGANGSAPFSNASAQASYQVVFDVSFPTNFTSTGRPDSIRLTGPGIDRLLQSSDTGLLQPGRYTVSCSLSVGLNAGDMTQNTMTFVTHLPPSPFNIPWSTLDCGGGEVFGQGYHLQGTIGQFDATLPFLASGYFQTVLASNPAAYWRLDEASGTAAINQIGAPAGNGTYNGTFTLAQAGAFASDSAVTISHGSMRTSSATGQPLFAGRSVVAVECWIKPIVAGAYTFYLQYGDDAASRFSLEGDPINPTFWLNNSTSVGTVSLPVGQYTHVVLQIDGTNARIYRNGAQVAQVAFTGTVSSAAANLHAFTIGSGRGGVQFFANASFDEAAVYTHALTAAEIAAHYQAGLDDFTNFRISGGFWAADLGTPPCTADFDDGSRTGQPDGGVTIDDLLYYLELFNLGSPSADLDDGSFTGVRDGGVTLDDLLWFLFHFGQGC